MILSETLMNFIETLTIFGETLINFTETLTNRFYPHKKLASRTAKPVFLIHFFPDIRSVTSEMTNTAMASSSIPAPIPY